MHEYTLAGWSNFGVDHFQPKSKAKALECAYENLYYCCNECNRIKRDVWPTDAQRMQGYRFADACLEVIYGKHLKCKFDGTLVPLTRVGKYTEERIDLNREYLKQLRRDRNEALVAIRKSRNVLRSSPFISPEVLDAQKKTVELLVRLFLNPPTPPGRKELSRKRAKFRR